MLSPKNLFPLIIIFVAAGLEANSRISFSRPGKMMRIPSVDYTMKDNLLALHLSSEILSSKQNSTGLAVNTLTPTGMIYGMSLVRPVYPENSTELGFHLQKNLLVYGNVHVDIGMHDLMFRTGSDTTDGLETKGVSLFAVLSNEKTFEDFAVATHLGIGSGKINSDSHLYLNNPEQTIGVFLGFQFYTPFLKDNGGVSLLTEFDGTGLNIGLSIPILNSYHINFAITHFENFGNFATENKTGTEWSALSGDAPSITIGLGYNISRAMVSDVEAEDIEKQLGSGIYAKTDSSILYYDPICTEVVETLKDSIRVSQNIIENLEAHKNMLQHTEAILIDSTRKNLLREQVSQANQNKAMRHLSRSLRFFYDERYRDALSEVNSAIELSPDLAIAYGRRGSIYYKLGDTRRATLNWNVALQLDPEFSEIYDILKAADEHRLTPVEIGKNTGDE